MKKLPCIILLAGSLAAADWKPLFNGKNLDGCGFHTGQIPRDLLQQAVDILPVRGRTWEGW